MDIIEILQKIRVGAGKARTVGLADDDIHRFAANDSELTRAAMAGLAARDAIASEFPELLALDEPVQIEEIQRDLVNFYSGDAVNPYVAIAAAGPWIITSCGAVLHDSGGYGMLGFGHDPQAINAAMSGPQVMANVMTANVSQLRLTRALRAEIGHTRGECPFARFVCMNSGSEAVTVAARIADVNTKLMTDAGGRHAGKPVRLLSLRGSFHGRTDRPARYSDSTRAGYTKHLASYRDDRTLHTVAPNDVVELEAAFAAAEADGVFIEAFFLEPVMGEGNPGVGVTPEFYRTARRLTEAHGALLLVDSIQAGLRATGNLSLVDYPGFEECAPPDMETYSKALNAGQYPLSVLAMTERAAGLYRTGIYGNTMTANPRALDVAVAVLESVTPQIRENIRARGVEFLERFAELADQLGGLITRVQGTGLLLSCELSDEFRCFGVNSTEEWLRLNGIGVIHGGRNSLRFTPHFAITSDEIALIVQSVGAALLNGPRQSGRTDTQADVVNR
ncbi:MAG: aminotransferase class III-fold pyridoxal phosphate-dependent enzyme [Gammaproteobacteria bacterium]